MPIVPTIYGLMCSCHHTEGIRYVGQTTRDVRVRLTQHLAKARTDDARPVSAWIRKHGEPNILTVALAECESLESLDAEEREWIAKLDTLAPTGLNLMAGGRDTTGLQHGASARAKIGAASASRTHSTGTREKMSKAKRYGRSTNAKLSVEQVIQMKRMLADTVTPFAEVGKPFGVGASTVSAIYRGELWSYVGTDIAMNPNRSRMTRSSIDANVVRSVKALAADGLSNPKIADKVGQSVTMVWRILNTDRFAWAHVE